MGAWLDHQPQCTKPVECGHRSLGALVASAGPAQPSSFITAFDGFVCDQVHNVHTDAQGQSRRLLKHSRGTHRFRFHNHSKVKQLKKKMQKLKSRNVKRQGVGGHPKLHHRTQESKRLKHLRLKKDEFQHRLRAAM